MISRERVIEVIRHGKPDRVPVYAWVKFNLSEPIKERFGSVEAFEDHYEFDFAHLFGGPPSYSFAELEAARVARGGSITPKDLLQIPMCDPDDHFLYESIKADIAHHKEQRGRFVYMQTPGIFEALNDPFGIENHLWYMIEFEDDLRRVYQRQANWNRRFAMNCIDLGIDMVHVSDDWGGQNSLLFSPKTWWNLIYPNHKSTIDAVKKRKCFVSLHSDGNINSVIDGILKLGYDVVHPWQESAGMDLGKFKSELRDKFTVMGGLDVQTTIGFGKLDFLRSQIERVLGMFADGGLLFCTTHFVQDHCTIDELVYAFDLIHEITHRKPARKAKPQAKVERVEKAAGAKRPTSSVTAIPKSKVAPAARKRSGELVSTATAKPRPSVRSARRISTATVKERPTRSKAPANPRKQISAAAKVQRSAPAAVKAAKPKATSKGGSRK